MKKTELQMIMKRYGISNITEAEFAINFVYDLISAQINETENKSYHDSIWNHNLQVAKSIVEDLIDYIKVENAEEEA